MKDNKGFSLIELIIVITITAVLLVVLVPNMVRYVEKAKRVVDVNNANAWAESANQIIATCDVKWSGKYGEFASFSWNKSWTPSDSDITSEGTTDFRSMVYREIGLFLSKTYPDAYIYVIRNSSKNAQGIEVYDTNTIGKIYIVEKSCPPPTAAKIGIEIYPDATDFLNGKTFKTN